MNIKRFLPLALVLPALAAVLSSCGGSVRTKEITAVSLFGDDRLTFAISAKTSPRPDTVNGYYQSKLPPQELGEALRRQNTPAWENGTLKQVPQSQPLENALFLQHKLPEGGTRYYLLYDTGRSRKNGQWVYAFSGLEARLSRGDEQELVVPLPYFSPDALPDKDGILSTRFQEKQLYRITGTREDFRQFYESIEAYRMEETKTGFRLLGYTDAVAASGKAPPLAQPVSFVFHELYGISYVSMQ